MRPTSPFRSSFLLVATLAFACAAHAAESKKTADYYLTTPADFAGKSISLDVVFVKPVHFQSPIPDISFFHVVTIDKRERRPGGEILAAVATDQASAFASRYGTNFSDTQSKSLQGTLLSSPTRGPEHRGIWFVDTTGKLAELISSKKIEFDPEAAAQGGQGGPGGGGPGPGGMRPHRPFSQQ